MPQYRVCVADDDEGVADLLRESLLLHNYDVCVVSNGLDAIKRCREGGIDLILLDVCLPDIDGYEVCRRLKESPATADIPVIFVTVKGSDADRALGMSLGAAAYVTKPYNPVSVMVYVGKAIRDRHQSLGYDTAAEGDLEADSTDPLTGLHNRPFLVSRLQSEVEEAHRYNQWLSVAVFDIDEVRGLDEELGKAPIDDLLAEIAMTLKRESRTNDILARYDGTVLAAVLPHTSVDDAIQYGYKIFDAVDRTTYSEPSFPTRTSLRAGVVACRNGHALDAREVLGRAMGCLLQARSLTAERLVAKTLGDDD